MSEYYLKEELYRKIREDDDIFEFLQSGSLDGIWYWDMEQQENEWLSPRFKSLFGYENDEVPNTSKWWQENIFPEDLPAVLETLQRHLEGKAPYDQIVRYRHKDGSTVWVRCRGLVIRDESGKPVRLLGAHTDVSELKRMEEQLRLSELRARALLDSNPDLIFRMNRGGQYLDFHATDEGLLAVPSEEIIGHNMSEFFEPSFVRECQGHINNALDTGEAQLWEYQLPIQGEIREFETRIVRSGVDEVIVIAHDITERSRLEREVISISEKERSRIASDLHDGLGQELTGISLALQTLSQNLMHENSPHVQAMQKVTAMLQKTIGETRDFARQLSPIFSTELGLCAALGALAEEVEEYSDIRCHLQVPYEDDIHDPEVATHLYRIAQESVNNALKHSGAQNIDVRYRRDGDSLFLEILDDGMGIPARENRVEGIGLRNMNYRARMINGSLDVAPRKSSGTRVLCTCSLRTP